MSNSKRRKVLYPTSSGELATDKQLWKINNLSMQVNNVTVELHELSPRNAYMEVYATHYLRINLPITKREASKAILDLEHNLKFQKRKLEDCKVDA